MTNLSQDKRLIHLIYASAAKKPFSESELVELLKGARKKNLSLEVTGMLLYYENTFFQIIEGEEATIQELFKTISKDTRHHKIVLIVEEPIPIRAFPEWSMGFSMPKKSDLASVEGLSDVLKEKEPFLHIQQGRATKLLDAFSKGRWRLD